MGAGAPDKVLYIGGDFHQWQKGEPRRINLNQSRVPDLVGEIADTTLTSDLDEKKRLYAALQIPDVLGSRYLRVEESFGHFACRKTGNIRNAKFPVHLRDCQLLCCLIL